MKRDKLVDPAGTNLTAYNLQALDKAVGKAKSNQSIITYRDVTLGKGSKDLGVIVHGESSLLNVTKFTLQQGASLIMVSKSC